MNKMEVESTHLLLVRLGKKISDSSVLVVRVVISHAAIFRSTHPTISGTYNLAGNIYHNNVFQHVVDKHLCHKGNWGSDAEGRLDSFIGRTTTLKPTVAGSNAGEHNSMFCERLRQFHHQ